MTDQTDNTKRCTKCDLWLDRALFWRDASKADGLFDHCKTCKKFATQRNRDARIEQRKIAEILRVQSGLPIESGDQLKRCPKCQQWLNLSSFWLNPARFDGYECYCTTCSNADCRARRSLWDDDKRKAHSACCKIWKDANPEKVLAFARAAALRHPERAYANQKRRREANPEQTRLKDKVMNSKRRTRDGDVTPADLVEIFKLQRGRCAYCRVKLKDGHHADHIMPVALNGGGKRQNIQLACGFCNRSKGAKHPLAYARSLGRLL